MFHLKLKTRVIAIVVLTGLLIFGCDSFEKIDYSKKNHIHYEYNKKISDSKINRLRKYKAALVQNDVQYANYDPDQSDKLTFDMYRPVGINDALPLIIYIHSGGFITGDNENHIAHHYCMDLARAGFTVASIDYRQIHMPRWDNIDWENSIFQANIPVKRMLYLSLQDASTAIRYFYNHSNELNIDPNNIYVAGFSAGGIIALNLMFMDNFEAKDYFGLAYNNCLSCLSCIGDYSKIRNLDFVKGYIAIGAGVFDSDNIGDVGNDSKPLLLMHGNKDEIVDINLDKPFKKYRKDITFSVKTPVFFIDLGIDDPKSKNDNVYKIGGYEIGVTIPGFIMKFITEIFTPDIYGSNIVYENKNDNCTLLEINNGPHTFMINENGSFTGAYYESLKNIIGFVHQFEAN